MFRLSSFLILVAALVIAGCDNRAQNESAAQLPTRAVLPSPTVTRLLNFWQPVNGSLTFSEQVDRWQFVAEKGDQINVRALGSVNLVVQASDGLIVGTGTEIAATLPAAGSYTVLVQLVQESSDYELGLSYTDRPNPAEFTATPPPQVVGIPTPTPSLSELGTLITQLNSGEIATMTFENSDEINHVYTFEGTSGEFVTINMSRTDGTVDPALKLFSPTGKALAVDHNSGGARGALLRNVLLPEDGLYSVQASSGGFPGDYELVLLGNDRPQPITPTIIPQITDTPFVEVLTPTLATAVPNGRLDDHIAVTGNITDAGSFARHSIYATSGDFLTIGVRPLGQWRPFIELYSPEGEQVIAANVSNSNAGGDALISMWPVTETGTYSLFVNAENNATGQYIVSYGVGPTREDVLRGATNPDVPYDGQIARRGLRDIWGLTLNEGDVISVAVSPLNTALDPIVELVGPDGQVVAGDDNGGGFPNALLNAATIPTSGRFQLRVIAANGASVGPYRIIWRYINIAPTKTPEPVRALLMTVEDFAQDGQYLFYPFQGRAGQKVRVQVNAQPGSPFDPVAALIGPDGQVIAEGDDSDGTLNPSFSADITADGTYNVRVNGYLSSGAFELVVDALF
jgi:hypothetical protein